MSPGYAIALAPRRAVAAVDVEPTDRALAPGVRLASVDACRGVAVVGMLLANLVNVLFREIPAPLAHNQGDALRLFDFPAPLFQFMVGLSLPLFLARAVACGRTPSAARWDALRRFALLIGLGMVLDGIGAASLVPRWGVLQTLGLGGIVATLLTDAPIELHAAVCLVLLGMFSGFANGVVHANGGAALAFVPLTLAGVVVGRAATVHALTVRATGVAVVGVLLAGAFSAAGVPFNKVLGTSSFVALATAVAAALVVVCAERERRGLRFPPGLLNAGRYALTVWVLLHVLVYYPAWLVFPQWGRLGPMQGTLGAISVTAMLLTSATALGRRGLRISL